MKIFISQPIAGKTDDEIKGNRKTAEGYLKRKYWDHTVEFLDSFFEDYNGNAVQFLGKSLMVLAEADLVVFLPGWKDNRGCRIEHMVALEYDYQIAYLPEYK